MGMTNLEPRIRSITARLDKYNRKGITMANVGIKESKEALAFGFTVAAIIKGKLKDGFQTEDVSAILEALISDESVAELKLAVEGAGQIGAETENIDFMEGFELSRFALTGVKKVLAA